MLARIESIPTKNAQATAHQITATATAVGLKTNDKLYCHCLDENTRKVFDFERMTATPMGNLFRTSLLPFNRATNKPKCISQTFSRMKKLPSFVPYFLASRNIQMSYKLNLLGQKLSKLRIALIFISISRTCSSTRA